MNSNVLLVKQVGKVSVELLAREKTKVLGTFPPRNRGWIGYVEKDTAGQTNIYSVEPAVYVAKSAISSGIAGSSADGSKNARKEKIRTPIHKKAPPGSTLRASFAFSIIGSALLPGLRDAVETSHQNLKIDKAVQKKILRIFHFLGFFFQKKKGYHISI
ncbi:Protein MAINTENANCE OF PSII UNDER HIGH LIGHT 1 [Camellia lanceoleosa]|uniref:Protein MAINTENANCE OF PSII UNDER HIGH LIGHT 1 n=1 Tax=Camellia lanceoleosa TaxID=1840588 RepID=A0ACC0J0A5_9ERIC|nr:Protein MAINTENANCE OF PSII UNDER HIGH LIGHT 1 [Camellia lanceoleosa]